MSKQHSYRILHQGKVIHELVEAAGGGGQLATSYISEREARAIRDGSDISGIGDDPE